ncbi:hypothetical protein GCM10010178_76170 [Lentzea flava]|uniref:Uncharacterized protein n=1 Tax=Lentzea flava TaxID=103732 RepID=A0ABQ2V7X8_9PSEU|nr:hypothetical protein GCM10010178_76170 [Lentzea flava]
MVPTPFRGGADRRRRSPSERSQRPPQRRHAPTSLRGFSVGAEDELCRGSDEIAGSDTDGTTVVTTTLDRGSAASGVTTGLECGGGVTTGRAEDGREGATFTADGTGVNSMGG